jgi:hypothetical protein
MKKQIGVVGVDSGQILICDPCYIDSQWKKEEFSSKRRFKHKDGTILNHTYARGDDYNENEFKKFDDIIPKYNKCMNDMIADNDVVQIGYLPSEHNFSYAACAVKTLNDGNDGQLNYEMGHAGIGVVSGSFGGDGVYPVIADIDEDGLVRSITIKFN